MYCGNDPSLLSEPPDLAYSVKDLRRFLEEDEDPIICFYGGEPLLALDVIEEVMDSIEARRWILQTNGLLLKRLRRRYLTMFDTILVSIDGRPEVTDYYRGRGVYEKVIENVKDIRSRGFRGDIIARMAVSGATDIYRDVVHLLELENPKFDHVHWQLDVLWDYPPYQRYTDFDSWVDNVYNPGISRLVNYWIDNMMDKGEVKGIVPFLGLMKHMLLRQKPRLHCGAGLDAFAIAPSGRIMACPVAYDVEELHLGHIKTTRPRELPGRVNISGPCPTCDLYWACGGRCLYANKTMLWGLEGFCKVCKTVRHLVSELLRVKPIVEMLIRRHIVELDQLIYPKYNNSTEIIP